MSNVSTETGQRPSRPRYHVVLNVSSTTHGDNHPVTYLDQGRTYLISVLDSTLAHAPSQSLRYQSVISVYFDQEQPQAAHYAQSRLWNNQWPTSPGTRASSLTPAIEYISDGSGGGDQITASRRRIRDVAFDSFRLEWTSNQITGGAYCVIPIRLNFFDTDFSAIEAMDGKAMTVSVLTHDSILYDPQQPSGVYSESSILNIHLFSKNRAEQKFLDDCRRADLFQSDLPLLQSFHDGMPKASSVPTRGKESASLDWSPQSGDLITGNFPHNHEVALPKQDLVKLQRIVREPRAVVRPVSTFVYVNRRPPSHDNSWGSLRAIDAAKVMLRPKLELQAPTAGQESLITSASPNTDLLLSVKEGQAVLPATGGKHSDTKHILVMTGQHATASLPSVTNNVRNGTLYASSGRSKEETGSKYTETDTLGARPEVHKKPVACFYIRTEDASNVAHRAVYLMKRSIGDLVAGISVKLSIPLESVSEIVYFNANLVQIAVDEDVVRQLPDGQDLVVRVKSRSMSSSPTDTENSTAYSTTAASTTPTDHLMGLAGLNHSPHNDLAVEHASDAIIFQDLLNFEWTPGNSDEEQDIPLSQIGKPPVWSRESQDVNASPVVLPSDHQPMPKDFALWNSSTSASDAQSPSDNSKHGLSPEPESSHKKARNKSKPSVSTRSKRLSVSSLTSDSSTAASNAALQTTRLTSGGRRASLRVGELPPERASSIREANRLAARTSRHKRLVANEMLVEASRDAAEENARLKMLTQGLESEVQHLTGMLEGHRLCCGNVGCHGCHVADGLDEEFAKCEELIHR